MSPSAELILLSTLMEKEDCVDLPAVRNYSEGRVRSGGEKKRSGGSAVKGNFAEGLPTSHHCSCSPPVFS